MNKKTPIEQEKANYIKTMRTLIRLKHSIAADNEINDRIPDELITFDKEVQAGNLPQSIVPLLEEALNEV